MEKGYIADMTYGEILAQRWYHHESIVSATLNKLFGNKIARLRLHKGANNVAPPVIAWRCSVCFCVELSAPDLEQD